MPLSNNDIKILVRLLENRLNASWEPDVADLLERIKSKEALKEKTDSDGNKGYSCG